MASPVSNNRAGLLKRRRSLGVGRTWEQTHTHSIIKNSAKSFVLVSVILSGPSTPRRAPPRHTRFRRVTMNENSRHSASAQELRFSSPKKLISYVLE